MYDDNATVNKLNLVFNYFYLAIVFLLYFSAFIYGKVEAWFFIGLFLIALISYGASLIVYFKNKEDSKLKLRITSAFILLYLYIMILGHTEFRFALVFPPLCLLVMYHNTKFVVKVSAAIIAVNLLNVFVCIFVFKRVSYDYTSRYTIQMISIVLACICIYCAARAYSFSFNRIKMQHLQLEQMSLQTIETIANTIDAKDPYTQGHSRRVAEYSEYIAQKLGYSDEEVEKIKYIALLHDVGKIAVPDPVLNKPSKLTDTEYEIMKTHTVAGGDILKDIQTIPDIALGAMYHHERFDGKGYPEGLAGEDIPMIGRIIGLADAYDAMTSNRIYRRRLSRQAVIDEIKRCRGTQFDPECVDAFMDYVEEFTMDDNFREKNINTLRDIGVSAAVPSSALEPNEDYEVDRLTGFYNRELGERSLDEMLKHQTGAIILINMVGLRLINMEYGFRRGDYYLKIVGGALLASEEELLPIRFDGNEFVCFMPGVTDKNVISKWMDNLLGRIQALGKRILWLRRISVLSALSLFMMIHLQRCQFILGHLTRLLVSLESNRTSHMCSMILLQNIAILFLETKISMIW